MLFVGGLPQVVVTWLDGLKAKNPLVLIIQTVRTLQKKLLAEYKADFAKYHPRDALNIARTWEFVAENLSRSFSLKLLSLSKLENPTMAFIGVRIS